MSQAAPRSGITGKSRGPQELSRLAVGDERSELGPYCDEGCGREGDPTLARCARAWKVRTDHAEKCFDELSALWTSLHEALSVRITTLLNKLINLHGVRVTGLRFEDGSLVIGIARTFKILNCPHCGFSKRGRESRHRYLTVVTDHDSRKVIWVAEGKSSEALKDFFTEIGADACEAVEIATIDMSAAYRKAIVEGLSNGKIVFDHFHVAKLANEAFNEVRRELVRNAETVQQRKAIKGTMWPLLHRLENTNDKHMEVINRVRLDQSLGRAYMLKEELLDILRNRKGDAKGCIKRWMGWAARSRLRPFVRLGRTIRDHFDGVLAIIKERITNSLAEGINNKIRLLSHRAFGFRSASPLIATIFLCCGGISLPCTS